MKYYSEYKVNGLNEVSQILMTQHRRGEPFGFYFDQINTVRVFTHAKNKESKITPKTQRYVECKRIRAKERQSPRQQQKRMQQLKKHLAKKGIEYQPNPHKRQIAFDYYLNIFSFSSQAAFRLYIKSIPVIFPVDAGFDSYGLSKNGATLPLF